MPRQSEWIRPTQLKHRVTLQTNTPTRSASGAAVASWADTVTVWASIENPRGREFWEAQKINAEVTTIIKIRHRSGITPSMRAVFGDRTFDILAAPDKDNRRRELSLLCKELL